MLIRSSKTRVRALTALLWLLCAPVHAETRNARQDRLDGLGKDDLSRLAPELTRGPVALVEFADMNADQLPAVNIAVPIHARADTVTRVLTDPAGFPRFMPTLDRVEIIAKHDSSIVYDWAFDMTVLRLRGRNTMTIYPAPKGKPDAAARVTIDSDEGDLGRGRMLFRVHPRGAESLLVLSLRLDLREANFVVRQVAKAARSVNRSANIGLAFSMALHTQEEAERRERAGAQPAVAVPLAVSAKAAPALHKPPVDLARLAPLLNRGDLLLFEHRGTVLEQLAAIGAVAQKLDRVQEVMHDAKAFGSSLVPGSKAEVVSHTGDLTVFDWKIDLPLLGVSGQMRMKDEGKLLTIDATKGALHGGRWQFELSPVNADVTLVNGWAHFTFDDSSWLLEKLTSADPYLAHGMIGASQLMLLRAVRSRSTAP